MTALLPPASLVRCCQPDAQLGQRSPLPPPKTLSLMHRTPPHVPCETVKPWQEVRWPRDVELRKVHIYEKTSRLISLARLQPACTASHFRSTFHIEVAGGISHLKRGVAGTCT